MVEITHQETGIILYRLEADTLEAAKLAGAHLDRAGLQQAQLDRADQEGKG